MRFVARYPIPHHFVLVKFLRKSINWVAVQSESTCELCKKKSIQFLSVFFSMQMALFFDARFRHQMGLTDLEICPNIFYQLESS